MTLHGIGNKSFMEKIAGSYQKGKARENETYFGDVAGNLGGASKELEEEKDTKSTKTSSVQVDYHSGLISTKLAVSDTGRVHMESTMECEAKHITYAQSDQVKLYAVSGYTLKAKTVLDEHKVYIEQTNEDGTIQGYMVNPLKVPADSTNPVELLAKECWENTRDLLNGGTFTDATAEEPKEPKTYEEALLEFYDFVEERVKNGPPKIQTGGGEFSIEEWDKLLEEVDGALDAYKEELRERIAKLKAKELLSSDTEKTALANASDEEDEEEEVEEVKAPARGRDFKRLLEGKKAPYSYLADENGMIDYKGVTFFCDYEKNQITLGDMSDKNNVITVPLSGGGFLKVHRNNIDDLVKAIDMFSPQDMTRILQAIAQDKKVREMQQEIDDMVNGIGVKKS